MGIRALHVYTTFILLLVTFNEATSSKKKKTLWKGQKHVGNNGGLSSSVDRGIILSNAADGVDESNENSIRREETTTSVDKKPYRKFSKPDVSQTIEPLKKKLRRKKKKERRLRRIKLRKLRHRFKSKGFNQLRHQKICKSWSDCGTNECCLWQGKKRYCKKRPKRGQRCKPSLLPGVGRECPCQTGLTCSLPVKKRRKNKKMRHRCIKVKHKYAENYLKQNDLQ